MENLEVIKHERNISTTITFGLNSDIIISAMNNIDFKESRKLILEKPLYCKPIRNITPKKPHQSPVPQVKPVSKPKTVPLQRLDGVPHKAQAQAINREVLKEKKKGKDKNSPSKHTLKAFFSPHPPKSEFAKLLEERSRSSQRSSSCSGRRSPSSVSPSLRKRNSSELDSPSSPLESLELKKSKVSGIPLASK